MELTMAKNLSQSDYRASHGKRPGGMGTWIFRVSYCNKHTMRRAAEGAFADRTASVREINEHTLEFTFVSPSLYSDCTRELRQMLAYDRNAEIVVLP